MESAIHATIHRPRLGTGLWLASALGFCLLGQYYFSNRPEYPVDAAIFYAIGLFSFWRVLTRLGAPSSPAPRPYDTPFEPVSRRWPLMFVSLVLAALAYWACAHNTFTRLGVLAWVGAVLSFLVAMWPETPTPALPLPGGGLGRGLGGGLSIHLPWRTVALLAIIALAAFFRLYRLDQVPPEMTSDHIEKLLDIHDLGNGMRPIYFERNTGREPFQFYWAFTVMRAFNTGITFYGLKLANALIGILAIYGIYLLGRELAGQDIGLLAAFLASVMQWATSITRMGLRFPYATVATAFALWALLRALRTGRRADYLLAGLLLGAGFYGYTAFRVMPIVVAALVMFKLIVEPPRSRPGWSQLALGLAVLGVMAAIVFVPLGRYWHDRPEMFWHRSLTRIEGEYGAAPGDVWLTLGRNTLRALGMFNVVGDTVWANTVPHKPTLDEVGGAFLLLGVLAALYRLFSPKAAGQRRDWPLLMAIGSGIILLLPSILSLAFPNENPSVVRAAGAIPVVTVLVALGIYAAAHAVKALGGARWGPWLAALLLAVVLAATTYLNYGRYFKSYLASYRMASQNSSEMAESMRGFIATGGDLRHITIRAWPHWVDTRALALIMGDVSWQNTNVVIDRIDDLARQRDDPAPQMYLLHRNDKDGLALLQKTFPPGYVVLHRSPIPGHEYMLFLVPAR
jgi:4-amino-4-deoxy-L-arabinose transferase-like glycosyltransferase